MRIRTDDEVYRVDAVWLGPPKATFPWRARYVAWGVGTVIFLLVLTVLRNIGISLFWSLSWGMVATIGLTMLICSRISHERPLGAVLAMWLREVTAPREVTSGQGGAASAATIRVRAEMPRRRTRAKAQQPGARRRTVQQGRPHRPARPARSRQATQSGINPRDVKYREVSGVRTP